MSKWPTWLKVLVAVVGIVGIVGVTAFSQLLLYLDRMGASKFDL